MATLNIGMRVNRAITGATTVTANAFAVVSYSGVPATTGFGTSSGDSISFEPHQIIRVYGPGQSIPASFTANGGRNYNSGALEIKTYTYSLVNGVEIINTI